MSTTPITPMQIVTETDDTGVLVKVTFDGFTTEHQIQTSDLTAAGWITKLEAADYCPEGHCGADCERRSVVEFTAGSRQVMEDWHNDHHPGVFRVCTEDPCRALAKSMEVIG